MIINESSERPVLKPRETLVEITIGHNLLAGLDQARLLTNSVVMHHMPDRLTQTTPSTDEEHDLAQQLVLFFIILID